VILEVFVGLFLLFGLIVTVIGLVYIAFTLPYLALIRALDWFAERSNK
jgi:uncharacterized membrane protein YphA (DoxX/SURF4 family)